MQFGKTTILGQTGVTAKDPVNDLTNATVETGSNGTDGDYHLPIHAGGVGMVIQMVSYTVVVVETGEAQVFKFWRVPVAGLSANARAISINAADDTGATTMTIPLTPTQVAGDVHRVYFGGDADEDHVINPGESFVIEIDNVGTDASEGIFTVHGYYFDVGPQIPVNGTAHTAAVSKPNANGAGSIYNLIG